ncbi:MAG: DUF4836 family protein [Sphingomonadales bacterium]|nr:DUF4836 family protein [Sphingomonadales bacterium]
MNKKTLIIAIVAITGIAGAIWFFNDSKNKLYAYVPKESIAVGKVSIVSLFKKMDFEKIKKQDVVADAMDKIKDEAPKFFKEVMESPDKSGVDFKVDPVVFFSLDEDEVNNMQGGILLAVDNKENIKKLIENIGESAGADYTFREDKDMNKAYPSEENDREHAFAWNNDVLVITFKEGYKNETNISNYAEKILSLEKTNNIYETKGFGQFVKNSGDVDFFVNMDQIVKILNNNVGLKELSKNNARALESIKNMDGFSAHLNFEDASVDLNSFVYYENPEKVDKLLKGNLDKKYTDYLTSNGKSVGAFGASLDAQTLIQMTESVVGNEDINEVVIPDYTMKDILKMLTGEFAVSVSEFKEIEVTEMDMDYETFEMYEVKRKRMMPVFNLQLGISKPSDIKKIIEFMASNNYQIKSDGGVYSINSELGDMYIVPQNDRLIISTDPKAANIKNGNPWQKPSNENITKTLTENAMAFYLSLNPDDYPLESMGGKMSKKASNFMGMMQDLTMVSTDNDKSVVRLNLKKGEGNSLYRLVNGILELGDFDNLFDSNSATTEETPYMEEEPAAVYDTAVEYVQ